jgi:Zn-dependent protease
LVVYDFIGRPTTFEGFCRSKKRFLLHDDRNIPFFCSMIHWPDFNEMTPSGAKNSVFRRNRWQGYTFKIHVLYFVFPAMLLIASARNGAAGLSVRVAQMICWYAALVVQQWLIPYMEVDENDQDSRVEILIWPLGIWHTSPLSSLWSTDDRGKIPAMWPSLANLLISFISAVVLGMLSIKSSWNPVAFDGPWTVDDLPITPFSAIWWLGQWGHVNWMIGLASLLPAAPLAGVHLVNHVFETTRWDRIEAIRLRRLIAVLTGLFCLLTGIWLVSRQQNGGFVVMMVGLAIFLETRQQIGYDNSIEFIQLFLAEESSRKKPGRTTLFDDSESRGSFTRLRDYLAEKRQSTRDRRLEKEREERILDSQRLDRLLALIHERGLKSLGWRDRRFLRKMAQLKRQKSQK